MKTYLVTGGAGFIGSNFIHYMLRRNQDIHILNVDALTYAGNLENLSEYDQDPRYTFAHVDIRDKGALTQLFET
ncbi:MAG: GDP-mannose 4,6-dehydratase, partial [Lancefieldella parvula]|nr:GDP-mannose 4,6-dehydratase [Lancefieldella parvula]